jgi:hypothetical protein
LPTPIIGSAVTNLMCVLSVADLVARTMTEYRGGTFPPRELISARRRGPA